MAIQMNSGMFRNSLYLQRPATPSGGNPAGWENVATVNGMTAEVRCHLKTASGTESTGQSGERGGAKVVMTTRYRSDITNEKRFTDGSSPARIFDIVHVNNVDELGHKLIIDLAEKR